MAGSTRDDGRRRGRGLMALLVVLALLVAALVAADIVARRMVQQRIASTLESRLGSQVQVDVQGPSALYQLATDHWQAIHVQTTGAQLARNGRQGAADIDVTVSDARGLVRGAKAVAGGVDGTVTMTWADLGSLSGAKLTSSGQGRVTASTKASIFGQQVPVVVQGRPSIAVAQQQIQLADPEVTVDGAKVSDTAAGAIMPVVQQRLQLPTYPGLRFTSLQTSGSGAVFTLQGKDVSVSR